MAGSSNQPVVETTAGKIRGTTADGVHAFKGVAYGASTSGHNRFMAPQKPEPWGGVRDAVVYAGRAPQAPSMQQRPELAVLPGAPDTVPESEDCLTLNLWSGGLGATDKRPVMVWFHGGAFSYGSANTPRLDGATLAAREGVVVVSVNQRLNIMGHLNLAEFGGEAFANSGNAGTLDMLGALQWVRDNIQRFGGDAGNVTIFGHSGGGGKVSTLLAMPAARGLFQRAIVMSGAAIRLVEHARSAKLAEAVLAELGVKRGQIGELQAMPFQRLIAAIGPAQKRLGPPPFPLFDRYDFGPVVDGGGILATQPFDPGAPETSRDVPLMIGDVKDEMAIFLAPDDKVWMRSLSEGELRARVEKVAGVATDRVMAHYRQLFPAATAADRLISTLTDSNFRIRTLLLAERKAAQDGAPIWLYSFDWETPIFGGKLKSYHALDVPFVFDTLDAVGATDRSAEARKLARRMSATWAHFARTGQPENLENPHWPAYTSAERATLVLDGRPRVVKDEGGERRTLWKEVLQVA